MKIGKRQNGSYVLRVGSIEATISGADSLKKTWELFEKLLAVATTGDQVKEMVKAEPEAEKAVVKAVKKAVQTERKVEKVVATGTLSERIKEFLATQASGAKVGEISKALDVKSNFVASKLLGLKEKGEVKRVKSADGFVWSIKS